MERCENNREAVAVLPHQDVASLNQTRLDNFLMFVKMDDIP